MFANFYQKLKTIWTDPYIRNRLLFILGIFIIFRLLSSIPIPGVNAVALQQFLANNQLLGFLNIFSGGGLSNLSILLLGVGPFITASIILQLLTLMVPRLKEMYHEEGEMGRKKFNQYSRLLTVPIALVQGFSLLAILAKQGILSPLGSFAFGINVVVVIAGALLAMWLGELISEFGIGNGVSIMIFAGIVASLPTTINQALFSFDMAQLPLYIGFLILAVLIVFGVVMITEAERPIPVTYAKQVRGGAVSGGTQTYVPLRINQAGVMPIIFALSILLFPQMIATAMQSASHAWMVAVGTSVAAFLQNQVAYTILYFVLVFVFTYFYTAVTFDADAMANNLQKNGAFVPGVRPGASTSEYVARVLSRITFFGGIFLGLIAVLPQVFTAFTGNQTISIGGTALLIVVAVIIDLVKKLSAQASMREY